MEQNHLPARHGTDTQTPHDLQRKRRRFRLNHYFVGDDDDDLYINNFIVWPIIMSINIFNMMGQFDLPSRPHGGSRPGRRPNINRDFQRAHDLIFKDYFSPHPLWDSVVFARRWRINKAIFLRIMKAVEKHDPYFTQSRNAAGKLGASCLQKVLIF